MTTEPAAPPLRELRVAQRLAIAEDICAFDLEPVDGAPLAAFEPGAHVDLHLPLEAGGYVRPYSLCGAPEDRGRWRIAVLREPASRGGSAAIHAHLREGSTLRVGAPRQQFALDPSASRSLLLAGGIGITPLLPMADRLHATGADFEFHHCTRTPARTPFRERIAQAPWVSRAQAHLSEGRGGRRLDIAALLARQAPGTHLYACGPAGFMTAALDAARAAGWPETRLHVERFGADVAPRTGDEAFEVALARTGGVVPVPANCTVIAALRAAGHEIPTSREQGLCGTCLVRVLDGVPDHRDAYLTPEERAACDQMLPCCSRALGPRLVLDL